MDSGIHPPPDPGPDWYWGKASKHFVKCQLTGAQDGSFVVHDSTSQPGSNFVLTLKSGDGSCVYVKIIFDPSTQSYSFGPADPHQFNSVDELIQFYKLHSLAEYNPSLDLKLTEAPERLRMHLENGQKANHQEAQRDLASGYANLILVAENYNDKQRILAETSDNIAQTDVALRGYELINDLFSSQIDLAQQQSCKPHEQRKAQDNCDLLLMRQSAHDVTRRELSDERHKFADLSAHLDTEIRNLSGKLESANSRVDFSRQLVSLMSRGNEKELDVIFDAVSKNPRLYLKNPDDGLLSLTNRQVTRLSPFDSRNWLCLDLSKAEANRLLSGMPDGTFLIRKSDRGRGFYALSVALNGSVQSCLIISQGEGPSAQFCFDNTDFWFSSLQDLVLFYTTNSLALHAPALNTCLKRPVKMQIETVGDDLGREEINGVKWEF